MGATTVMMAADADMPDNLCGIIADCGFTSPYEIISSVIKKDYHIPPLLIAPAINAWCRALAGFDLRSRSVTETLSRTSLPLLLIHGKADLFVPFSMGEAAYRACASSDKTFIAVDGAGHGESYFKDREAVTEAISSFFTRTSLRLSVR